MIFAFTLLACLGDLWKTDASDSMDTSDEGPSVFSGADYPLYTCCWPVTFYAYTRGGTGAASVTLDWSYADPATREQHSFTLDPDSTGNAWKLELYDEDTVHDGSCDEPSCAVRINAYDEQGGLLGCITRGGERSWVDAEECHSWVSAF